MGNSYLVIGGDVRQYYLAEQLQANGEEVKLWCVPIPPKHQPNMDVYTKMELFEEIKKADILLLPIPVVRTDGMLKLPLEHIRISLEEFCQNLQAKQILFGGNVSKELYEACDEKNVRIYDYMKLPGLAEKNAIATAEGTIAEAVLTGNINLEDSHCVVTGYGRCAKVLADKLYRLGARVSVIARNPKQREAAIKKKIFAADMNGTECRQALRRADYVFNTVPALVLDQEKLDCLKEEAVIIDIASYPGGVDFAYCMQKGITARLCLGLPGKYSPKTSGLILEEIIRSLLSKGDLKACDIE